MTVTDSLDVEKRALGCLLLAPALIARAEIGPEQFWLPEHRRIVSALLEMPDAAGMDPATLADMLVLRKAAPPDRVLLAELAVCGAIPSAWPHYADLLREACAARALREAARQTVDSLDAGEGVGAVAGRLADEMAKAAPGMSPSGVRLICFDEADVGDGEADGPTPHIIEGLLAERTKGIITSRSKMGKTWLLLQLGLSVAAGLPFLNRPTRRVPVLFVDLELEADEMRKRLARVRRAMFIGEDHIRDTFRVVRPDRDVFGLEGFITAVIAEARRIGARLVIIDPVYTLFKGRLDELRPGDQQVVLSQLNRLRHEARTAVVSVGHAPKGSMADRSNIDRQAGSGVPARDADSIISIVPLNPEGSGLYRVDCDLRYFPPIPPFGIRREFPVYRVDADIDVADVAKPVGGNGRRAPAAARPKAMSPLEVAELMGDGPMYRADLVKAIMERYGCTDDPAYKAIRRAETVGLIGPVVPKGKKDHDRHHLTRIRKPE